MTWYSQESVKKQSFFFQEKFGATPEEAERLLRLAVKESFTPGNLLKRVAGSGSGNFLGFGCKSIAFTMIAIILGFFGIPLLLTSVGIYYYNEYQIKHSHIVLGTVTQLNSNYQNPDEYLPVISYQVDENDYVITGSMYADEDEYTVGSNIQLYVNNEDPETVLIDSYAERWSTIAVAGSIGFVFTVLMIVFIRKGRKLKVAPKTISQS